MKKKNERDGVLGKLLQDIKASLPKAREQLTLQDLQELIRLAGGPKTVQAILKAKETLPQSRIPWLFNSLDSQLVIDILHYDMTEALARFKNENN